MAHQSLYRRYRSRTFGEIVGQPHVTSALRSAVAQNRWGHAYLFSGPRGTGKTSTARVLAKALNCINVQDGEPCTTCESCLAIENGRSFDLHELDAASNNKVDDIRDLISKVVLGSPGRTKVYILDEVHMLSPGAENALLKTLEEPPEHVVFVLATTEPHKVVETIRSRTQHHTFNLLPADELAKHVRWVIADAGLDVGEDAIDYALRKGGGSARDTLSALDLVAATGGVPAGSDVPLLLVKAIGTGDPAGAIAAVQGGLEHGREPRTIGEETLDLLRDAFLATMGAPLDHLNDHARTTSTELGAELGPAKLTRALESIGQALVEMRQAPDPRVPLEVSLLRLTRATTPAGGGAAGSGDSAGSGDTAALLARIDQLEQRVAQIEAGGVPVDAAAAGAAGSSASSSPAAAARAAASAAAETTKSDSSSARSTTSAPPSPRSRRRAPTSTSSASASPPGPAQRQEPPRSTDGDSVGGDGDNRTGNGAANSTGTQEPAAGSTAGSASAATGSMAAPLSLTAVTEGLADELERLTQKVRVRFKGGRILEVDGATVSFGVPHPIQRDRCLEVKADVEQALSARFGQALQLDIVVDTASEAPIDPAKLEPTPSSRQHGGASGSDEDDIGPVTELADANDLSKTGVERITRAFPGSQVVDAPSD